MVIAVVGRGMIGSAAARHLARSGEDVILIGPDEPARKSDHPGVFGSHYDEGRITRAMDASPFWSEVSRASIARYAEIASESGISFFTETGSLMVGPQDSAFVARAGAVRAAAGIAAEVLDDDALAARFPWFRFAPGHTGFHEARGAGHISPRKLVEAQCAAAARHGARVVRDLVVAVEQHDAGVTIVTDRQHIKADQVLIAAGGFTNMLVFPTLPLRIFARTVAYFEVDAEEVGRLAAMPTLIVRTPDGQDPYLLPPIRYPDGRIYLKLGGERADIILPDAAAARDWFQSGGSPHVAAELEADIRARMPDLAIKSVHHQPCILTYTAADQPLIDRLSDRACVAVGGCGRGAKCSDELGRLAAQTVTGAPDPALGLAAAGVF